MNAMVRQSKASPRLTAFGAIVIAGDDFVEAVERCNTAPKWRATVFADDGNPRSSPPTARFHAAGEDWGAGLKE